MKSQIKLYRVFLNIIFYIFYVLLASIAFSFIFPTILVIFGQEVWLETDPRFTNIQIGIIIIILVFSLIFRKYCYLPIRTYNNDFEKIEKVTKNINIDITKQEKIKEIKLKKTKGLDIKIGKEIKK